MGDLSIRSANQEPGAGSVPLPALIGTDESSAGYSWRGALQQRPLPLHRPESACYGFKQRPRTLQQMATCPEFRCLTSGVHSNCESSDFSLVSAPACARAEPGLALLPDPLWDFEFVDFLAASLAALAAASICSFALLKVED